MRGRRRGGIVGQRRGASRARGGASSSSWGFELRRGWARGADATPRAVARNRARPARVRPPIPASETGNRERSGFSRGFPSRDRHESAARPRREGFGHLRTSERAVSRPDVPSVTTSRRVLKWPRVSVTGAEGGLEAHREIFRLLARFESRFALRSSVTASAYVPTVLNNSAPPCAAPKGTFRPCRPQPLETRDGTASLPPQSQPPGAAGAGGPSRWPRLSPAMT